MGEPMAYEVLAGHGVMVNQRIIFRMKMGRKKRRIQADGQHRQRSGHDRPPEKPLIKRGTSPFIFKCIPSRRDPWEGLLYYQGPGQNGQCWGQKRGFSMGKSNDIQFHPKNSITDNQKERWKVKSHQFKAWW